MRCVKVLQITFRLLHNIPPQHDLKWIKYVKLVFLYPGIHNFSAFYVMNWLDKNMLLTIDVLVVHLFVNRTQRHLLLSVLLVTNGLSFIHLRLQILQLQTIQVSHIHSNLNRLVI